MFNRVLIASLVGALGLIAPGHAGVAPAERPVWPQANSDLAADPSITFGVLDNGLRYAIRHNATPVGQASMRFVILAGSMQEAPDQEGLAHFLEHMAFHGSTHVPDGDMDLTLERLGMRLGPDINAQTGRDVTIYKFDLVRGDDVSVDTGLKLFREIGSELVLDPKLMDAERRVVLAEAHAQAAAQEELQTTVNAAVFGDHPYARLPIGRSQIIETAPVGRLRDFYDAYYRPERAVLIVVGDIEPAAVEARIKARFADWRGRGAAGADPAPMSVAGPAPHYQLATIKDLGPGSHQLNVFYFHPYRAFHDGRTEARERIIYDVAAQAAQARLTELNERAGRPFAAGKFLTQLDTPPQIARIDHAILSLVVDVRGALNLLVAAQQQLLRYGLTRKELDIAIAVRRSQMEGWAAQSPTEATPYRADELVADAEYGVIPLSANQSMDLFNDTVASLTADSATDNLRAHLTGDGPLLFYAASDAPDEGQSALKQAYETAVIAPVSPFEPAPEKSWTSPDFGPPGAVAELRTRDDLGVTMVRFANGLRLTVKPTNFANDQILVTVRFGHGRLDFPNDKRAASDLAADVLNMGGFRDLSLSEANRALADKNVMAFAKTGEDAFSLNAPAPLRPEMFDLAMQVLAAKIATPGWRTYNWSSLIASKAHDNDADDASPLAVYQHQGPALLHPRDMRWGSDTPQMRAAWKAEDAVDFIKPILETSPLEVVVVGDIGVDRAIGAVAGTLGALPSRPDIKEPPGLRDVTLPAPTAEPIELHHDGAAFQAACIVTWPTTDAFADTRQTHAAQLLADIMQTRAFDQVRNKEGKTYSPGVSAAFSETLPGYGMILAGVLVQPVDAQSVFAELDAIAADLAAHDVSPDELARAQGPRVAKAMREQRQNGYWLHHLAGAQTDPRLMQMASREVAEIENLTAADVRAAAQKWLVKAKSWRLMVTPRSQ